MSSGKDISACSAMAHKTSSQVVHDPSTCDWFLGCDKKAPAWKRRASLLTSETTKKRNRSRIRTDITLPMQGRYIAALFIGAYAIRFIKPNS
jgi:hypothetical protein